MAASNQIQTKTSGQSSLTILPEKLDKIYSASEFQLANHVNDLTPAKSFGGQMSNFVKNHPEQLFSSIEKLLAELAMSVNVVRNIEPYQLPQISKEIYSKYYFFSLDEIALVLRKGKNGEFRDEKGKAIIIFDRLDVTIIMAWMQAYDTGEREQFVGNARTQLNEEYESQNTAAVINALGGAGALRKLIEHFEGEKEEFKKQEENYKEFRSKYFKKA